MTDADPKIIDLLKKRGKDEVLTSLEYFPPRTESGVKNLHERMDRMRTNMSPVFTDITWGAGGSTAELTMDLARYLHNTGHVANMHLTCTNMAKNGDPVAGVQDALQAALDGGIRNLVALRGDPPAGQDEWKADEGGFTCALDLVKYIREHFGDTFGISVAGYPEGHPNAISELSSGEIGAMTAAELGRCSRNEGKVYVCKDDDYMKEMVYLKEKVDAGADFIITQLFWDVDVFKTFVNDCRKMGIMCPVVPGLMCINAYAGFKKMNGFCKTRVPEDVGAKMESIKDESVAVKAYGVEFGAKVCQSLLDFGVEVLHFYTLNLEKVVYGITDQLGITTDLISKSDEKDANSMVAVGSAWARMGDNVKSIFGDGIVKDIRKDGTFIIESNKWNLANNQKPMFYLQKGNFEKIFA